jgi:regulator of protease activity HflC (stomatin/prohibitin superfamily)
MQDSRSTFGLVLTQVTIKTLATVATSLKSSMIKRTQKERDQEANINSGRNLSKQNSR